MAVLREPRVQLIAALLLATLLTVYLVRRVLHRTTARLHRIETPAKTDEPEHPLAAAARARDPQNQSTPVP